MRCNTMITAHSGADGTPDNSLEYIRYALTTSADAFEIDIRDGGDGELVLTHDLADDRPVPLLREALELAGQNPLLRINFDHKEPGLSVRLYQLLQKYNMEKRAIWSGSVDLSFFRTCPDVLRNVEVFLNLEEVVENLYFNYREIPDFDVTAAEQAIMACRETGIRVVNVNHILVTRRFIDLLREQGIGVSAWTVNDLPDMEYFLSHEIYNITTRRPKMLLERF